MDLPWPGPTTGPTRGPSRGGALGSNCLYWPPGPSPSPQFPSVKQGVWGGYSPCVSGLFSLYLENILSGF